jgi:hypothetical protein
MLLGEGAPDSRPPLFLCILWMAVFLARLPSITYSLDEDSIWCLIEKINQPWIVTLGFKDAYTLNHIANSVLAKLLIQATGYHFIEFTYRVPSLIAGAIAMPLGYAVFSRAGGRHCGVFFSIAVSLLPAISLYATNSRGYMLLVLFTIWAFGLTPGIANRLHPLRLGLAYFLLASSHGLGILNVCCLAALGCYAELRRAGPSGLLANGMPALPGLVFNFPMLLSMRTVRSQFPGPEDIGVPESLGFFPEWLAYQFGSAGFASAFTGAVFTGLMIYGTIVTFRRSKQMGIAMGLLISAIPVSFFLAKTSWSQEWYSMGCIVFWLWAVGAASSDLYARAAAGSGRNARSFIIAYGLLYATLLPRSIEYLKHPRQDYSGAYESIKRRFPQQEKVYCFSTIGLIGLEYYSRRFGIELVPLTGKAMPDDALWQEILATPAVMEMGNTLSQETAFRLKEKSTEVSAFRGLGGPLSLYYLKSPAN